VGTARFAELAAGAGACLRRPLKRRELAPTKRVAASRIRPARPCRIYPPLNKLISHHHNRDHNHGDIFFADSTYDVCRSESELDPVHAFGLDAS
jgi:hypothetical protein